MRFTLGSRCFPCSKLCIRLGVETHHVQLCVWGRTRGASGRPRRGPRQAVWSAGVEGDVTRRREVMERVRRRNIREVLGGGRKEGSRTGRERSERRTDEGVVPSSRVCGRRACQTVG